MDFDTIARSIAKTHHLITVEQGWPQSGKDLWTITLKGSVQTLGV